MLSVEQMQSIWDEVEALWRSRTPAKRIDEIPPGTRVSRSEVNMIIRRKFGANESVLIRSDDWDRMWIATFDRLRKEFPDER